MRRVVERAIRCWMDDRSEKVSQSDGACQWFSAGFITQSLLVGLVSWVFLTHSVSAQIVIRPVDAQWVGEGSGVRAIDSSGMDEASGGPISTGSPVPRPWPLHVASGNGGLQSVSGLVARVVGSASGSLVLDLGGTFEVDGITLWNYCERHNGDWKNERGIRTCEVEVSSDGGSTWTTLETLQFSEAPETLEFSPQVRSFSGGAVTANAVRLNVQNFESTIVGLSEIRFTGNPLPGSTVHPMSSATRPFIWAKMSEREAILDKIENHDWAASLFNSLVARVQDELDDYEADRDGYLRGLPVDWSRTNPRFFTDSGVVNNPLRNRLDTAQDCSVIYYLTGDPRYAAYAADVLHNTVRWFPNTPKSTNRGIGGWTFHDREWLYESRSIGSQMPIIYDFLHGYLQNNQMWDVHDRGLRSFSFTNAAEVFTDFRNLCRDKGYAGTNWSALMGDCMILNTLALDNVSTRNRFVDEFLYTDFDRQDSLKHQEDEFDGPAPFSCYPESLGYSIGVVQRNSYYIALLDRYDPSENYGTQFPKLLQSLHRTKQMHYPNNVYQLQFGDGQRLTRGGINYTLADILYSQAKAQGRTEIMAINGGLLADGLAKGDYRRGSLRPKSSLNIRDEVLPLLWGTPVIDEEPEPLDIFRTDTLPYAGLALQRNFSPTGDNKDALTSFVQGAGFVHSHASGMNMELYGRGRVLGVKGYGRSSYARSFASANTVITNGYSRGAGGWGGVSINTVQLEAMEPAARQDGVSPNISFSTTSFRDNKGSGAEAVQERTMAVIRTSPTTGYYFDLYRSNSSLGGEFHDYLYHNIGTSLTVTDTRGLPLSMSSQPNRFQNDNDSNKSPGWGAFTDTMATSTVTGSVRAQFATPFPGEPTIYMDLHVPGDGGREYATAMAPGDGENPDPYKNDKIPTLVVRRNGQAWDNPFGVVFEPHQSGANGGTVQEVSSLKTGNKVVGMQVDSVVDGQRVTQYVFSHTGANDRYEDFEAGISFKGRFGVVTVRGDGSGELYLGQGSEISYGALTVSSNSGNNTQASVVFDSDLETTVVANTAVTVDVVPTSGPVAHWPLDEGSGVTTAELTGRAGEGQLLNGATWGSDEVRDSYVSFDGVDDRIATSFDYALSDGADFTWAWWANKQSPDGSDNGSIMVGNRYGGNGSETFEFIKFTPVSVQFANSNSTGAIESFDYPNLPSNEWNHYAMVKTGRSYQWYVNGQPEGEPVTLDYSESAPLPFFIGGDDDGSGTKVNEHFEGFIDDVVLYREALTPEEVVNVSNGIYFPEIFLATLGTPVTSDDGSAWSDGLAAHGRATYVVPATGNLRSESGSSEFPGESLTIRAGGRFQVRAIESDVLTVGELILEGGSGFGAGEFAELAAGTGSGVANVIDGRITQSGATRLLTFGGSIARRLTILSQIEGDGVLQVSGEGVTVANESNTFSGTWGVEGGSRLTFGDEGAVGSADIEVQSGGTLEILGDWESSATLAVADTASTEVVLGAFDWWVSTLSLGGVDLPEGVYNAADLSALGSNARFTGTGSLTVGDYVEPVQGVVAGWDTWSSNTAPVATVTGSGITASVRASMATGSWTTTDNNSSGRGASVDQTWGSYDGDGNPASRVISGAGSNMTAVNGVTRADLTFTIANTGPAAWDLKALHMDVAAFRPGAPQIYQLEVLSGDLTQGVVFRSEDDAITDWAGSIPAGNDGHDDIDIDLSALADSVLEPGERAVIQLSFSGGSGSAPGHHLFVDNVSFSGTTRPTKGIENWRFEYFGTTANAGEAADSYDANFDGEPNLLEFATGQDPWAATVTSTPLGMEGNVLEFIYTRSKVAMAAGVTFEVQWSDTLAPDSWDGSGVTEEVVADDGSNQTVRASVPIGSSGRRFLHLRILQP